MWLPSPSDEPRQPPLIDVIASFVVVTPPLPPAPDMSSLRRPLTWAVAATLLGLASSPAAQYQWEGVVFVVGGVAVVAMELLHRPRWRAIVVWGWMLDAAMLTMAGLMFRIVSSTTPSGTVVFALLTLVAFGAAWAVEHDAGHRREGQREPR